MLHEIEYLEIAESPITMVDAVMQAIGTQAMPENQEEVAVDTDAVPNVQLELANEGTQGTLSPTDTGGCVI